MSCSVNLIPAARLQAQARRRRRDRWLAVCGVLALALAGAWGVERAAARAVQRLTDSVQELRVQRTEVSRRLVAERGRRSRLLARLQTLAAARRPQPWPRRLLDLTRAAPEGILLTGLTIAPVETDAPARADTGRKPALQTAKTSPALAAREQSVRLLGFALDHGALLQFLDVLQSQPGWRQVELVRATQEAYRGGQAVAFEVSGRTLEDTP